MSTNLCPFPKKIIHIDYYATIQRLQPEIKKKCILFKKINDDIQ